MRSILIVILLVTSSALNARDMFVVVNVSERVVVHYVCEGSILGDGALLQKTIVAAPGRISWHVVGGIGPYTMLDQYIENGVVFISVIDAAGTISQGSALLRVTQEIIFKDCARQTYEFTEAELIQINDEKARRHLEARASSGRTDRNGGPTNRTHMSNEGKRGGGGAGDGFRSTYGVRTSSSNSKGSGGSGGGGSVNRTHYSVTYR